MERSIQRGLWKERQTQTCSIWLDGDWKERGISVTSSLQFEYEGKCINILDTPGHEDFSEDTYRTLMAADCAVMVIDASKGVEPQTIKLFKVCVMRHIPIHLSIRWTVKLRILRFVRRYRESLRDRDTSDQLADRMWKEFRVYTSAHQEISYDSRQSPQVVKKQKKRLFQQMMIMQQIWSEKISMRIWWKKLNC